MSECAHGPCTNQANNPMNDLCDECAEDRAMAQLAKIEPPEGGWPRGSTMDQI